jgi:hypothetical protein
MNDLEILRRKAASLITESSQPADIQLGAELLKAAAEIENQTAETHKRRDPIAIITPWVSTILLVGGFLLQGLQLQRSEREKATAREDAEWSELQKSLPTPTSAGTFTNEQAAQLAQFLKSREYGEIANNTAEDVLRLTNGINEKGVAAFNILFADVFPRVDWNNLDRVVNLDRSLSYDYDQIRKQDEHDPRLNFILQELKAIGPWVAHVLRRPRPKNASVDLLANVRVFDCDFSGVDLHGLNLSGFVADRVNLDHADLRDISAFQNGHWGSFWWHTDKIDPPLRNYLCINSDRFLNDAGTFPLDEGESNQRKTACAGE